GQEALSGFDQKDAEVALRVDAVEAVGDLLARGVIKCGRQFSTGRAGANDRDVKLARTHRALLSLRAQAGVDQASVEALRLSRGLQRHRMLGNPRCAEIIRGAAD